MNREQVNHKLLSELNYLKYTSRMKTSLSIQLSDVASQYNGFRTSRQVPGDKKDDVEDSFNELMLKLEIAVDEFTSIIKSLPNYKDDIYLMTDEQIESTLEEALYWSVLNENPDECFHNYFL